MKEFIITPKSVTYSINDLWQYRELFIYLVWRDIKIRYKQTIIGILWILLQPLITMLVFSFLFGTVAKIESNNIPYPIFVYSGLLIWTLFTKSVTSSSESLISNQNLVKKTNFPKIILPISAVMVCVIDFIFASSILVVLMIYYKYFPNIMGIIIFVPAILIVLILSVGIGAVLASINVVYRDIRFITPYALQMLMFLTPVVYPPNILNEKLNFIFKINPMTNIITSIRSGLFSINSINYSLLLFSFILSIAVFFLSFKFFKFREKYFADQI